MALTIFRPLGYQQITVLSAAVGLTVPTTDGMQPSKCVIQAESQDVRYRDDGTNPSATVGMVLKKDVPVLYEGDLDRIKFFETAASAKLNVSFYA